ncbi:reverse transcriptase domain protein [Colletotrichum truncatum]|uniref:Reverse transcriptase domain protein n=1 Tax=Colletotrichum truncatum TaxID=5467 RepID=A0ACC3YP46_COLTU|nr:reverse transcriptase domain protein [Colletotrichum truncatum]KAF6782764.1 reverse transcriptase domain protein [Colletotrichum truncatum]
MSSRASAKSPTPGSSSSSRNQPQSLAQEPANTEDFDMPDLKYDSDRDGSFTKESYDKLRRIIQKQEAETKDIVQLDLTEETKIFMFYQGLKNEYAELAIKIDNRLFERRKERGEKRQNPNSGRKYQWQPQHQFNNQRNDNRPRNNWNNPRQSTAYGHYSRPMDLSAIQRNDKKNDTYEYRLPKKERFQPVLEKRQASIATKTIPYEQLNWTTCFDDNCHIYSSSKEHAGWYPQKPQERSGYDTTNAPKRTLAVGYRSNSKIERKTIEQLDRDPARIRQINQELEEQVESETTKNTPNDSETPRDVARQHAQLEVAFEVASVDDTSSGEDSDEEIQWYHCYQDQRRVHYIKKDEAWKKQQENDEQGTDEQSKN